MAKQVGLQAADCDWLPALAAIGRSAGGGWDIDLIADAYRAQMGERLAKLKGAKLIASWTGFCESFLARRGRP